GLSQRGKERVCAAKQWLPLLRRAAFERRDDGRQLDERRGRGPLAPRPRHALGERGQRQPGVLEATEAVGREILERRRERPQELAERARGLAHLGRWCSWSGRTVNGPRRMSSIPSAAAAAAASVVKYGTRHSSAVRRIGKASRTESAPAGVL